VFPRRSHSDSVWTCLFGRPRHGPILLVFRRLIFVDSPLFSLCLPIHLRALRDEWRRGARPRASRSSKRAITGIETASPTGDERTYRDAQGICVRPRIRACAHGSSLRAWAMRACCTAPAKFWTFKPEIVEVLHRCGGGTPRDRNESIGAAFDVLLSDGSLELMQAPRQKIDTKTRIAQCCRARSYLAP